MNIGCKETFNSKSPPISKNNLPDSVAMHASYEEEIASFSEVVNDAESFPGSEGIDAIETVPLVERFKHTWTVYKSGNFEHHIERIEPKDGFQGITSSSPPGDSYDKEPKMFHINQDVISIFDRTGALITSFPNEGSEVIRETILKWISFDCSKSESIKLSSVLLPFSTDARYRLTDCYRKEVESTGGSFSYNEEGILVIRKPIKISSPKLQQPMMREGEDSTSQNLENKQIEENIESSLSAMATAEDLQEVEMVDTSTKTLIGKMVSEGENKVISTIRYKTDSDEDKQAEMTREEAYEINPITNTDKMSVIQTAYENVEIIDNN